ncbi:MAG: glycosyltransferase family 39 protein [Candidatus Rokubacteria bacterium]|nr:glycosyltransferase family 39 protein [Candidatus Rokubacteria bacterium]
MALVGVLALAALILTIPAGRRVFWSSDEARFALLAQDILDHGHWLVPELRGRLYLNKPQLGFWAIALVSWPVGRVTELTAAIPTILAALGSVGAVVAIGRLLWGWRAGLLAGLILATSPPFFAFGHVALPDMMLANWMTWSIYWLLRAWRSDWAWPPLAGFYVCIGLAVASKGPAGYAALAAGLVALLGTEGVRGLRRLRLVRGLVILALCATPWLASYHLVSRGRFEGEVLAGHYVTWYLRGDPLDRISQLVQPVVSFLPWAIFLVATPWWWRRRPEAGRRLLWLWTVPLWLLLGLSGTSRARYFVPVYPLFALLTAEFLARAGARGGGSAARAAAAAFAAGAAAVAVGMIVLPPTVVGRENMAFLPEAPWERAGAAALALLGGAVAWLLARRGAFSSMAVAAALALGGLLVLVGVTYPPRHARDNDVRALTAVAGAHTDPGAAVIGHPDLRLSYDFYLGRPVAEIGPTPAVVSLLATPPRQAVIMSAGRWQELAPLAGPSWRLLTSRRVGGREVVVVGRP